MKTNNSCPPSPMIPQGDGLPPESVVQSSLAQGSSPNSNIMNAVNGALLMGESGGIGLEGLDGLGAVNGLGVNLGLGSNGNLGVGMDPTMFNGNASFLNCGVLGTVSGVGMGGVGTGVNGGATPASITSLNAAQDGIAPFVCKLYELVNDASTQHLISWSEEHNRQAFIVWDPVEFATGVLPKFFKHSNFCSFVRQLNIYGFHKVESREGYAFMHDYFRFDTPHLLKHIQRRKPVHKKPPNNVGSASGSLLCLVNNQGVTGPLMNTQIPPNPPASIDQDSSTALYKCLLTEIAKLQKQNGDTQMTIQQLKEVLLQSKSREEQLELRIQKISEYLSKTDFNTRQGLLGAINANNAMFGGNSSANLSSGTGGSTVGNSTAANLLNMYNSSGGSNSSSGLQVGQLHSALTPPPTNSDQHMAPRSPADAGGPDMELDHFLLMLQQSQNPQMGVNMNTGISSLLGLGIPNMVGNGNGISGVLSGQNASLTSMQIPVLVVNKQQLHPRLLATTTPQLQILEQNQFTQQPQGQPQLQQSQQLMQAQQRQQLQNQQDITSSNHPEHQQPNTAGVSCVQQHNNNHPRRTQAVTTKDEDHSSRSQQQPHNIQDDLKSTGMSTSLSRGPTPLSMTSSPQSSPALTSTAASLSTSSSMQNTDADSLRLNSSDDQGPPSD
ncbi:heat shock transcription factor A4a [Pelomyxa schiedti]|nr:heat shock transcription factor A4a [Pelomyxa schiedti]